MTNRLGKKGARGALHRAALLPVRYGLTTTRLRERLRRMIDALNRLDVRPTINVTAHNLESDKRISAYLKDADVGIHGYEHVAYDALPIQAQAADLDRALLAFENANLEATGFRAPYLRANAATAGLLAGRHLRFDSSVPQIASRPSDHLWERIIPLCEARYPGARQGSLFPRIAGTLVEIPASLPDDEILVDGLGITSTPTLMRVFQTMLNESIDTHSLLVLQIHPERYDLCAEAVQWILQEAVATGAWRACLSDIATWTLSQPGSVRKWPNGYQSAIAVTGDLDALRLADFGRRLRLAIS